MKRSGRKVIVAVLLVTMLSQVLYSAAAGIFGLQTQSYAYADDGEVREVEPGEDIYLGTEEEETQGEESYAAGSDDEAYDLIDADTGESYYASEDFDKEPDTGESNETGAEYQDNPSEGEGTTDKSGDTENTADTEYITESQTDDSVSENGAGTDVKEETERDSEKNRIYSFEGDGVKVTAEVTEPDAVPEDAVFRVTAVTDSSLAEAYLLAMDEADDSKTHTLNNTLLYDVGFFVTDAETGEETEFSPKEGSVKISIQFTQDQLAEIGVEDASKLKVTHLPLTDEAKEGKATTLDVRDADVSDINTEEVESEGRGDQLDISLDSLSILGFTEEASDSSGDVNLGRMLKSVKINEVDVTNGGTVKLLDDQEYDVEFAFQEGDETLQFGPVMYYELPDGLVPPLNEDGTASDEVRYFSINLSGDYGNVKLNDKAVEGNSWHVEEKAVGGPYYIVVDLNTNDENYDYLSNLPNAQLNIFLHITKKATSKTWEFVDSAYYSGSVVFEEIPGSLTASKKNTYNSENKTLTFTVKVNSTGKNKNIRLYDHIYPKTDYDKILKYQRDTLNVISNKRGPIVTNGEPATELRYFENPTDFSKTEELFSFVTDLENGEELIFTYDVLVDLPERTTTDYAGSNRFSLTDVSKCNDTNIRDLKIAKKIKDVTSRFTIAGNYKPTLNKSANVIKNRGRIDYTITLNGDGKYKIGGETIVDEIYGEIAPYASYDGEGIVVKVQGGETKTISWDDILRSDRKGWSYLLEEAVGSGKVVITYSVKLDTSASLPTGSLWNKVNAAGMEKRTESKFDYSLSKYVKENKGYKEGAGLWYHIEYNGDQVINSNGVVVEDELSGDLAPYAEYNTDEPITIDYNYGDNDEATAHATVSWDDVVWKDSSHKGWSLTLGDYGKDRVHISYYVKVNDLSGYVTDEAKAKIINTVKVKDKKVEKETDYDIPEENRIELTKTHSNPVKVNGTVQNEWTVQIKVPDTGLNSCVVTDKLPGKFVDNIYEVDEFVEGSLIVSAGGGDVYYENELGYSEDNNSRNYKDQLKLTFFYQDGEKKVPGFAPGTDRTVTIKYRTKLNEKVIDASATNTYFREHVNNVSVLVNSGMTFEAQDSVIFDKKEEGLETSFYKTALEEQSYVEYKDPKDNRIYPSFPYQITLENITDDEIIIEDRFNENLKLVERHYDSNKLATFKRRRTNGDFDYNSRLYVGHGIEVLASNPGYFKLKITGLQGMLMEDGKNRADDVFRLEYLLTVVDEAAMLRLRESAKSEFEGLMLENTAKWNDMEATAFRKYTDSELEKNVVKKLIDPKPTKDNKYTAKFEAVLNPEGNTYLDGNTRLDVYDKMVNMTLKTDTFKVTYFGGIEEDREAAGLEYDPDRGAWHFTVRDGVTATITYDTRIVRPSNGTIESDGTVKVDYSNEITFGGYKAVVDDSQHVERDSEGFAQSTTIRLIKSAEDNKDEKLAGAEFQLFRWTGQGIPSPATSSEGWTAVTEKTDDPTVWVPVIRETKAPNGEAEFFGRLQEDGWAFDVDKYYAIKEIKAPVGFELDSYYHPFIVQYNSVDPKVEGLTVIPWNTGGKLPVKDKRNEYTEFNLKKVDAVSSDKVLGGAEFTLKPFGQSRTLEQTKETATVDGIVTFTKVYPGRYTVTETKAPDGYSLMNPVSFEVMVNADNSVTSSDARVHFEKNGQGVYTAVITNEEAKGKLILKSR